MINKWQKLRDFLTPEMFGRLACINANTYFAYLEESDPAAKTPKIQLTGIPSNSILIKIDQDATQPTFLADKLHLRHRCDYVLLTHLKGKDTIIFFELKSKNYKNGEVTGKFKTSSCLLDFLARISDVFYGHKIAFNDEVSIEKRYVLIYTPDKPTKVLKKGETPRCKHCTPGCYYRYPAIHSRCCNNNLRIHYSEVVNI